MEFRIIFRLLCYRFFTLSVPAVFGVMSERGRWGLIQLSIVFYLFQKYPNGILYDKETKHGFQYPFRIIITSWD